MLNKSIIIKHRLKFLVPGAGLILGALYASILKPVEPSSFSEDPQQIYDRNGQIEVVSLRVLGSFLTVLGLIGYKLNLDEKYRHNKQDESYWQDLNKRNKKKKK